MLAITADRNIRYERLGNRDFRPLTKEEAYDRDVAEIENLAKGGPISISDYYILKNGNIDEYINHLKTIIEKM